MIWQNIPTEHNYQASNQGKIRNSETLRVLKPMIDKQGYEFVQINRKNMKVHRLIGVTFIPNPNNKRCINHKNGIKHDNNVNNLEWCTHSENLKHAHSTGLKKPQQLGKSGRLHHGSKPLLTIKDTAIIEHESRNLCAKYLGVHVKAINSAMQKGHYCKGHRIYSL